jgi:hypothetical protein
LLEGEDFNQSVHCDWMYIGSRAFGPLDWTWTGGAAAWPASDLGTRLVSDVPVKANRAYRLVLVVTVASRSEFAECVEKWVHTLGAMRMTADGESANHSTNVVGICTNYCVLFEQRRAPYHPHHNGPVETMVKLLKDVVADTSRVTSLSVAAHWPLLIAHAADVVNVMPRVTRVAPHPACATPARLAALPRSSP